MQYISAYALASLSGKEPSADVIKEVLKATGKPVDDKEVDRVVASLKGKNIEDVIPINIQLIKKGMSKVGSSGGARASGAPKKEKEEKKKEEKKPEPAKKKEPEPAPPAEEDEGGMGDLFG